jgi:hypothetical protein
VATEWFALTLELVKETPGFTPPLASRTFGYSGVILYEAVVHGMPEHQSLAGQLNELAELPRPSAGAYHWPAVANAALAHITKKLFSNASSQGLDDVDKLEATLNSTFRPGPKSAVFERSVAHGKALAGFAPRSFSSFDEAAAEAATSRLYGGIHFRSAIELGLVQGKCIGERVSALKFRN